MKGSYFICAEYDPTGPSTGKLFFIMPAEVEYEQNWNSGMSIKVGGREYILGPRTFDKKSIIIYYELLVRPRPTALSLDD